MQMSPCACRRVSWTPTICEYIMLFSVCVSGPARVCVRLPLSFRRVSAVALLWPRWPPSNPSANEGCAGWKGVVWGSAAGHCFRIRGPDRRSRNIKDEEGEKNRLDWKKGEGYCQQFSWPEAAVGKRPVAFVLIISAQMFFLCDPAYPANPARFIPHLTKFDVLRWKNAGF